jgi:lipoic acid synthetase/lipoate-protein ligase A
MLLWALQKMGISATANGRNDILIGGRKVSGNAFYHLGHSNIVHGTLLYDTTMSHMTGALTPPKEKLRSKGVESIRQHVTLLKEHTTMSIGQVKDSIRQLLCADTYRLTAEEEAEAEAIMQEYLSRDFICGHDPAYTVERRGRIEGVGNFDISITLRNNVIKAMALSGDFFAVGDIDKGIVEPLINTPLNSESLLSRLPESLGHIVMNLRRDDLAAILLTADPTAAHDESSLQKTENQQTR